MVEKQQESDKASDKSKEPKPEQEAAKKEASGSQKEASDSVKRDFRQRAELNKSITPEAGKKPAEQFTISGREGKDGKGAAASEKAAGQPDKASEEPAAAPGDGAPDLSKPGVDKRTDKELEAAEDVKKVVHNADGPRTINYAHGGDTT